LKVRQALVETAEMGEDIEQLSEFDGITVLFPQSHCKQKITLAYGLFMTGLTERASSV